jgi:hypothetical protein
MPNGSPLKRLRSIDSIAQHKERAVFLVRYRALAPVFFGVRADRSRKDDQGSLFVFALRTIVQPPVLKIECQLFPVPLILR